MHAMRTHVRPSGTRYPNAHPTGHEFGRDWPGRRRVSCQATAWRASGTRLSTSARVRSIWQKSCDDSVQPAIRNAQVSPRKPTVAIVGAVDVVRFGLSVRALRRRRRWRQLDLADRAGVSRAAISRIERGRADRLTLRTLNQIADALVARIDVRLLWNGEGLDRLLDEEHAGLVEAVIRELEAARWEPATEVSFSIRGERGSVDVLAFHPATSTLLVVEVKSVVPDLQAMLATLDRKTRLAGAIGRERSWAATHTGRLLVVRDDRTARRRIASYEAIRRRLRGSRMGGATLAPRPNVRPGRGSTTIGGAAGFLWAPVPANCTPGGRTSPGRGARAEAVDWLTHGARRGRHRGRRQLCHVTA